MRITTAIRERLDQNARQRRELRRAQEHSKTQQIRLEYLRLEAQTFNEMLSQVRTKEWPFVGNVKISMILAIVSMAVYVLGIFYMFQEMDLTRVEQWQFAMTALPFWLIMTLVPVAIITFLTSRNTRY